MMHIGIGLNDVRFVGIWGMGGIGKTTIARAVFEAIQGEFTVCCFLANVREARERNRIVDKQKELVDQANKSAGTFYNEYDGQRTIRTSLHNKKVLLVLDDVSDDVELKNLAGEQDWFGPGSKIIITTRDIQLLNFYEVHGTYNVQGLVYSESFDLFCLKAFKRKKPDEEYLDLAKEVVKYSGGLPLALEVLGSLLCGRSIDVWRVVVKTIKSTAHFGKIHDTLKISYDNLDVTQKNIFLDIACFFKRWDKDDVTKLLESCGYEGVLTCIEILTDRSLVKINKVRNKDVFEMHDLLQDMGRNIVIQESPNNPGKRSRLWSQEDIHLVLANNQGSEAIQGIVLWDGQFEQHRSAEAFSSLWEGQFEQHWNAIGQFEQHWSAEAFSSLWEGPFEQHWSAEGQFLQHWSAEAFSNMAQLKLLIINTYRANFQFHEHSSLPTSLKVLHWYRYPLKTLPLSNQQYELVDVRLTDSTIENLWDGKKFLGKLKHLDLSRSNQLKQTPDLFEVPSLQTLLLEDCDSLIEVHPSLVRHKSLTLLDLSGCRRLEALPDFGSVPSLTYLGLSGSHFVSVPKSIHEIPKLKCLKLNNCNKLRCLPELPSSIRELEALDCDSLDISEFNILSKVCGVFVSLSQDPGQALLEMLISGSKIPSWFVHQQGGNFRYTVPIPFDYPQYECLGIALCLQLTILGAYSGALEFALGFRNGNNRFISKRIADIKYLKNYLYIIYLTKDYFSDEFHQGSCFELSILALSDAEIVSMTYAARWVSKEDIEDLRKVKL